MADTAATEFKPLNRTEMAARVARDIPEGWYVNLGIGIPTAVADHVRLDREVIFHSENGVLGMGPAPPKEEIDPWLINAGKQYVTLRPGGSFCHHADSFAMIRGGHLDLCVLGAFQVADNGDIANWATSENDTAPAVGGAMDLAAGAKRLWVLMEHTTKDGTPKLVTPLLLSADRGRRGEARLHQPRGHRRDRARLRRDRHGTRPHVRRTAGKDRGETAFAWIRALHWASVASSAAGRKNAQG